MILHPPDVPDPLLVQFPFPAWATRADEAGPSLNDEPLRLFRPQPVVSDL
jgi:hypothetical protein